MSALIPIVDVSADSNLTIGPGNRVESTGDAVQNCVLKQPKLVTSTNGLPAIAFDGLQTCLRTALVNYQGSDKITGAVVACRNPTSQTAVIAEGEVEPEYVPSSIWSFNLNTSGDNQLEIRDAGQNFENGGYITDALSQTKVIIFTIDRAITGAGGTMEMRAWLDGVEQSLTQIATNNPTGAFGNLSLSIGARSSGRSLAWAGHLHQFLVYPRLLSDAQILELDKYLAARWRRWQSGAAGLAAAPANGTIQGIVFPTPAGALVARNKIDQLLGYPKGNSLNYSYLRATSAGVKALVVDSTIREILRGGHHPELATPLGEQTLDVHTYGRDKETWPA